MSETQINREEDSLMGFQIVRVPYAILSTRPRFPARGPARAGLSSLLFIPFLFLFLPGLGNL
jgi:hypothetical protein